MNLGKRPLRIVIAAAGLCLAAFHAWAGEVQRVSLDAGATGTRAEIQLQGTGAYKTIALANPHRLVVDFPESSAVRGLKLPAPAGVVTAVRTGQPTPGTLRVVFDLSAPIAAFKPQMDSVGGTSRLVIEWPGDSPGSVAAASPAPAHPAPAAGASSGDVAAAKSEAAPDPAKVREEAARATAALTAAVVSQAQAPAPAPPAPSPQPSPQASAPPATAIAAGSAQPGPAAILNGTATPGGAAVASPTAVVPEPPAAAVAATRPPEAAVPTEVRPTMPSEPSRIRMQSGMRPLVVAIDPGHGGQDPGAIGPSGKREKDVTLAIARELARQVNATPGLKAYLTRDSDVFIPLPMRAQKARAAKADIFISIHADAAENRNAAGSSVYVLSTKGASSQRARWLADKENAADLVGGVRLQKTETTLANVLLDLAQSGHMKASEDAAGHVLGGLKRIGNNHKPALERANFAVLRTSDMPAMLVETAFISNPAEEKRLTDPSFQRRLAGAVLDGVNTFFTRQPPPGTLYAARAQAEADAAAGTVAGGSR